MVLEIQGILHITTWNYMDSHTGRPEFYWLCFLFVILPWQFGTGFSSYHWYFFCLIQFIRNGKDNELSLVFLLECSYSSMPQYESPFSIYSLLKLLHGYLLTRKILCRCIYSSMTTQCWFNCCRLKNTSQLLIIWNQHSCGHRMAMWATLPIGNILHAMQK